MERQPFSALSSFRLPRFASGLIMLLGLAALGGCGRWGAPALRVAYVSNVPLPNGLVEKYPWDSAPALTVKLTQGRGAYAETRKAQLKAVTDGRVLSIMVRWQDPREMMGGRFWVWDEKLGGYQLQVYPIDQVALMWPVEGDDSLDPWSGGAATWDVWRWKAGWSDLSGYADDESLALRAHPEGTRPSQVKGALYPLGKGRPLMEFEWRPDEGRPGTEAVPRPMAFLKERVQGYQAAEAAGSAADVRAQGVYTPRLRSAGDKREAWRYYSSGDEWFVEFYRLLVTGSKAGDDAQLRGRGPHRFAVALWDNSLDEMFFLSEPIRLALPKQIK